MATKMMKKVLREAQAEERVVTAFRDEFEESVTGIPLAVSKRWVVFLALDHGYRYEQLEAVRLEDVHRLGSPGRRAGLAREIALETRPANLPQLDSTDAYSLVRTLSEAKGYVVVHVEELDDDICWIGEVRGTDEETLHLMNFSTSTGSGVEDVFLELDDITRIQAGASYEEMLHREFRQQHPE